MSEGLNVHGSAVLVGRMGILVRGPARSGKSALCLSAIRRAASLGLESWLVGDDRVVIEATSTGLVLSAPDVLRGLIEISGVGIVPEPATPAAPLSLVVDLCELDAIDRMPEASDEEETILGAVIRRVRLPARSAAFGADVLVSLALADARTGG
ncbi:MAG: HPr kinase/phosphatase C-terminal domain-containing protein [Aurantimonas endophytica]|uniref:Serine kinase of HPr protein (Carbohydrate metabolism regulator) n=1 Tax=Aurantimonas endophytica TaxID=1522175 RepID=A0A7W6HHH0_9HYPH|nr:HPr kinase/phosphatase C-terminal domain-containing protein [Aurantimonas endophytica]MBB4005276.1 serine kinase of HPr protein (carbohydrate metabolism regulator) [Aurantimonas endophytica]MCO6406062.1 hypothetical protein [Aurantimonas endophytica]